MNINGQNLFKTTSTLLVFVALLSGPASSIIALEVRQESLPELVMQGSGDFPRLPVVAPAADGSTLSRGSRWGFHIRT
jgi:hypothetical protein